MNNMMRVLCLSLFLCLSISYGNSQKLHPFVIEGKMNADSGVVGLASIDEELFRSPMNVFEKVLVQNGSFVIRDSVPHPLMCRLFLRQDGKITYISRAFIVDSGFNSIAFDAKEMWSTPNALNASTAEFHNELEADFKTIDGEIKSIEAARDSLEAKYKGNVPDNLLQPLMANKKDLANKKLGILNAYVHDHPKSYVGLWQLIQTLTQGYSPIMDTIFRQFADSISTSFIGNTLKERLVSLKSTDTGNKFPSFEVVDKSNRKTNIDLLTGKATYTLVDFWFSHCSACISQFPTLRKLYAKYGNGDFDIIGISTDPKESIPDWLKVIKEEDISWKQYLDEAGKRSDELLIYAFPSNFLLKNGIIIRRDISMDDLEKILRERSTQR